jgi:hypothetical protein
MALLSASQLTTLPVRRPLLAALVSAESCWESPSTRLAAAGITVTVATGIAVTPIVALPLLPSLVALIVAVPGDTAVTNPELFTVAMLGASDIHAISRPVSALLFASTTVAVACVVSPSTSDATPITTLTEFTGTRVTAINALPVRPSLAAVIVALPTPTAVTRPVAGFTLATAALSELHVGMRPVSV